MNIKYKGQTYILNPAIEIGSEIKIRCRGREQLIYNLVVGKTPKETEFAEILFHAQRLSADAVEFDRKLKKHYDLLVDLGVLIKPTLSPSTVEAHNRFDQIALDFVDLPHRQAFKEVSASLVPNRRFVYFQDEDSRPTTKFHGIPPAGIYPAWQQIVWVFDPGTAMWSFYTPGPVLYKRIKRIFKGSLAPKSLDETSCEMLFQSRILIEPGYTRARAQQNVLINRDAEKTKHRGWTIARQVLSPMQVGLLRKYTSELKREGYFTTDERQVQNALRIYRGKDVLADYWNRQGGTFVRAATKESVFPSWALYSSYLEGAELKRHVDRDQCAWNASVAIGPANASYTPWSLLIEERGKKIVEAVLEAGDVAIYRGTSLPHWRPPLESGRSDTIMLWFYVPVNFMGPVQL